MARATRTRSRLAAKHQELILAAQPNTLITSGVCGDVLPSTRLDAMRDVNTSEGAEVRQDCIISSRERYTLSSRWIVRSDPNFHTPYSAFNIDSGEKYKISGTVFVILKVLENNCLTIEQLCSYLDENGIKLQTEEIVNFFSNDLGTKGILTRSECVLSPRITKRSHAFITSNVPVTLTPYEAEVHFTKACNLRCRHCVYDAGRKIPNELDIDSWIKIFDQLEGDETYRVTISGGEPLVYSGAKTLIPYLTLKRMRVDLLTNSTLIEESLAVHLSCPNFSTTVSLDGACSETHDLLRGRGCFDKVVKGLNLLSQAKANFHVATTVHKKNIHEMENLVEFAVELDARSISFILLDPIGRARYQKDLLLEPEDISSISYTVKRLADVFAKSIYVGYLDPSTPNYKDLNPKTKNSKIFCTAGTTRIAIRSDGGVFPCVYAFHDDRFAMGSTKLQPIEDIWLSESWELFRGSVELRHLNACKSCSLSEVCTLKICRLRAYYSEGDFFGRPPGCQKICM